MKKIMQFVHVVRKDEFLIGAGLTGEAPYGLSDDEQSEDGTNKSKILIKFNKGIP